MDYTQYILAITGVASGLSAIFTGLGVALPKVVWLPKAAHLVGVIGLDFQKIYDYLKSRGS